MRKLVRYSEAFKLQVIGDLEAGRFRSPQEARERYGITGKGTVKRWLRKYGREDLERKVMRVETVDEQRELLRLKKEVKELKAALAIQSTKRLVEETYYEILCEDRGINPLDFKKKHADSVFTGREKKTRGKA
jgi:transposase